MAGETVMVAHRCRRTGGATSPALFEGRAEDEDVQREDEEDVGGKERHEGEGL